MITRVSASVSLARLTRFTREGSRESVDCSRVCARSSVGSLRPHASNHETPLPNLATVLLGAIRVVCRRLCGESTSSQALSFEGQRKSGKYKGQRKRPKESMASSSANRFRQHSNDTNIGPTRHRSGPLEQ